MRLRIVLAPRARAPWLVRSGASTRSPPPSCAMSARHCAPGDPLAGRGTVAMTPCCASRPRPRLRRRSRDNPRLGRERRDRSPAAPETIPTDLGASRRAEPALAGEHDRLRAVLHADLVEDVRDVVAHRFLGELEPRRDLRVVQALRDQLEHLPLARRQAWKAARRGAAAGSFPG